jgi:ATP:ADP antiporter, AAA family
MFLHPSATRVVSPHHPAIDAASRFVDRVLRLIAPVGPGEGVTTLLMMINVFVLLSCYYVLKVVREPLILLGGGGAELKAYASAGQTLLLLAVVPGFGWLASRVNRLRLLTIVQVCFIGCLLVFYVLAEARAPIGLAFYLWLGIFSVVIVSNFWSFATDLYRQDQGKRLFAIIGLGGSVGAILGALVPQHLHRLIGSYQLLLVAAGGLAVSNVLYRVVSRRELRARAAESPVAVPAPEAVQPVGREGGFGLVIGDRYLRLMAVMLLVATVINTTGEYVVGKMATEQSWAYAVDQVSSAPAEVRADPEATAAATKQARDAYIRSFYSDYYAVVNLVSALLQALVVSRLLGKLGIRRALFLMPVMVLGGWLAFFGFASVATIRITKASENSLDYSLHNTVRQALYLPTSRASKYKAKAAIDTFFFRIGDVIAGLGVVFVLVDVLGLGVRAFAALNIVLSVLWLWLAARTGRLHDQRTAERAHRAAQGLRETAL